MPGEVTQRRLAIGLVVFASLLYLPLLVSPLRLTYDTVVLLSVSESAALGLGFLDQGMPSVYPPGYPGMVALLLKLGMAHPVSLVLLNLAGVIAGVFALWDIGAKAFGATRVQLLTVTALFLFSFTVFKQASLALTDLPFFGLALPCMAAVVRASAAGDRRRFLCYLVLAAALALASLTVRRTGVALLPPILWLLISNPALRQRILGRTLPLILTLAVLAAGAFVVIERSFTLHDFAVVAQGKSIGKLALGIVTMRLTELGELATDLPAGKMAFLPFGIFQGIGFITFGLMLAGMWLRRRFSAVEVFFLSWTGMLAVWPYYDPRFWIPVIPLGTFYIWIAVRRVPPAGAAWLALFCLAGTASLGYSASLSFAGNAFGAKYSNGTSRDTYCAAFLNCAGFDPAKVDEKALHVLMVYR